MSASLSHKVMLSMASIVGLLLCIALIWDVSYQTRQAERALLVKADLIAKQHMATRSFIARSQESVHGEPALPLPPAEVGKGVNALFADMAKSTVKQTREEVRDEQNRPDAFEQEALALFRSNPEALVHFNQTHDESGAPIFRYVVPVRADKACLHCHGEPVGEVDKTGHFKEGMKEGDLAGAISVTLPMAESLSLAKRESLRLAAGVVALALISLVLVYLVLWRHVHIPMRQLARVAESVGGERILVRPEELQALRRNREMVAAADAFEAMSRRLQELYQGLEQKVAERTAQLELANRDLERSAKYKQEFLTMVSHEFRTPLTAIISFTELLLGGAAGKLNEEQQEYLTDVLESSNRLLQMINDLLDLSRLEAGKVKLFVEVCAAGDLIRDAVKTVRPLAEQKGVRLSAEVAPDLPLVHADGLRVNQVLLNLLSNAIKYSETAGTITVAASVVTDADQGTGAGAVRIAVIDTGIGVTPAEHERIFEAFRQAGRQRAGSGLGLALARSLVELHGGRIGVESQLGQGATFWFTLPLRAGREGIA